MSHSWIPKLLREMVLNLLGCPADELNRSLPYLLAAGASLGLDSWLETLLVRLFIALP